jgi:hypothetical protein
MTKEQALAKSAAFYDKATADGLVNAMRLLLDQGAEHAFAEDVLLMQWSSWVANRESYLAEVAKQLEEFYEPTQH